MGTSQHFSRRFRHPVFMMFLMLIIVMTFNLLSSWKKRPNIASSRKTHSSNRIQLGSHDKHKIQSTDKKVSSSVNTSKSESRKPKQFTCPKGAKTDQYMTIQFKGGRTGNALFQLFCLLSLSSQYCYTAIIDDVILHDSNFRRLLPTFEILNTSIRRVEHIDRSTFHDFKPDMVQDLISKRQNWTLMDYCLANSKYLQGHEHYIKSSVTFRQEIKDEVHKYLQTKFEGRSTVAIHVRRTDMLDRQPKLTNIYYKYADLKWYRSFIEEAVQQLKANYSNLSFIFVSDDLTWCMDNFKDEHMHFSPFGGKVGSDLFLIATCDHVILTIGTFGWMGAYLGEHKTVIYSSKYTSSGFIDRKLPSWVGL